AARTLIRLLARSGNRADAVAAYRTLATHLDRRLDLTPDPDTRALVEAVRTGAFEPSGGEEGADGGPGSPRDGPAADHSLAVLPFTG
ncbi:MAG: hypothetical protein GWM90_05260, partial [Gemmatimonadetes bacterium]|nr:hypothetical protein [Gemmatimonadota bacterium]NIQ53146.1 hypothetical protein [Gemmatimonadota bacterium]NIU73290.1 hypothetical protein [Gammaproteobacteria bacterium]NIX43548.1 hypothetical protein [Gemmatimonadota bacterium]